MKPSSLPALFLPLLFGSTALAATPPAVEEPGLEQQAAIGEPVQVANVVVYPLLTETPDDETEYLTLDEALKENLLIIREQGHGGTVSQLHVTNRADLPIYALAGELLLGGKQDRIIGQNVIIPARAKSFAVQVYCVEHGRWSRKTDRFASGTALAHKKLRLKATKGQSQVWQEVAKTNKKRGTTNRSDTYRAAVGRKGLKKKVRKAVAALQSHLKGKPNVAGVAVEINGKPHVIEWFSSPKLFRKLEKKLLSSYVFEAFDVADGRKYRPRGKSKVRSVMRKSREAKRKAKRKAGGADVDEYDDGRYNRQVVRSRKKKKKAVHRSIMVW